MEHLPEWDQALAEMVRVARKRILVSVTPSDNALNIYEDPTHCVFRSWQEWRESFEQYGTITASSVWPWAALVELNDEHRA